MLCSVSSEGRPSAPKLSANLTVVYQLRDRLSASQPSVSFKAVHHIAKKVVYQLIVAISFTVVQHLHSALGSLHSRSSLLSQRRFSKVFLSFFFVQQFAASLYLVNLLVDLQAYVHALSY